MKRLMQVLRERRETLIDLVMQRVGRAGYLGLVSSARFDWAGMMGSMEAALAASVEALEAGRPEALAPAAPGLPPDGPPEAMGVMLARRMRPRGVPLRLLLTIAMSCRDALLDLLRAHPEGLDLEATLAFASGHFDRMVLALCHEWTEGEGTGDPTRELARAALLQSEDKTRFIGILESLVSPVFLLGRDGCLEYCNPSAWQLFGDDQAREATRRRPLAELAPDLAVALASLDAPDREDGTVEQRLETRRGVRYMDVRMGRVRDAHRQEMGTVLVLNDVTQRHEAEEALRQARAGLEERVRERTDDLQGAVAALRASEERFRRIFEEGPLGIATCGRDLRFTAANQAFCRMLGYDEAELASLTFRDFTHPDHRHKDDDGVQRLMRGEIPVHRTEKMYLRKTGEAVWGAVALTALRDAAGQVRSALVMVEDITDRKRTEATLAAEKEQLAVTLRSIADGVITTDTEGRIVLLNRAAEALTGLAADAAAGRPLGEVFPVVDDRDRRPIPDPVGQVLAAGRPIDLEGGLLLPGRDGVVRALTASVAPIRDPQNRVVGTVLVFRDVSERNRMEAEIHRAQKLESVGLLAGGIAHDFNNLLTGILGSIALARLHAADGTPQAGWLDEAEKAIDRAKTLTHQLLTFAKGGAPVRCPTRLDRLVRDAAGFALRGSKARCEFDLPDDLWPADVDAGQIGQVVSNLVINADEAMPAGGTLRIRARNLPPGAAPAGLPPRGRYVELQVIDEGHGIDAAHLGRIFDPYFTTKQRGSGLGLATCHAIVHKHDGQIGVRSEKGWGSTFCVTLPASLLAAPSEETRDAVPSGRGRILLMDDEPAILTVGRGMLERLGYEVGTASDGAAAVEAYAAARGVCRPFDAVIVDLTVPGGMGGLQTVRSLLALDPWARVIVSSGYSNDPVMGEYRAHGFRGVVAKPYELRALGRTLQEVLGPEPGSDDAH